MFIHYLRVFFCCIAFSKRLTLLRHDRACHRRHCIALSHEVSTHHRYIHDYYVESVYRLILEPFQVHRTFNHFITSKQVKSYNMQSNYVTYWHVTPTDEIERTVWVLCTLPTLLKIIVKKCHIGRVYRLARRLSHWLLQWCEWHIIYWRLLRLSDAERRQKLMT